MKNMTSLMTGIALACALASGAQAQVIGGLAVAPQTVKAGEPVAVTATVDVVNANYCGFIVFFGDGTSVEGVSDANQPGPLIVSHTYAKAGQYTLSMGGRHVQSHPNCGGADKFATVTVQDAGKSAAGGKSAAAAAACPAGWKVVAKSTNAKTGAFACSAKAGTAVPEPKPACPGDLTYYENVKKGQLGCRP